MIDIEVIKLINLLKKENENNSPDEKLFNDEWIKNIKKAWATALDKKYGKNKEKKGRK